MIYLRNYMYREPEVLLTRNANYPSMLSYFFAKRQEWPSVCLSRPQLNNISQDINSIHCSLFTRFHNLYKITPGSDNPNLPVYKIKVLCKSHFSCLLRSWRYSGFPSSVESNFPVRFKWFYFIRLCDWFGKFAPISVNLSEKQNQNQPCLARICFPALCAGYKDLLRVPSSDGCLRLWVLALVWVLGHSIENRELSQILFVP